MRHFSLQQWIYHTGQECCEAIMMQSELQLWDSKGSSIYHWDVTIRSTELSLVPTTVSITQWITWNIYWITEILLLNYLRQFRPTTPQPHFSNQVPSGFTAFNCPSHALWSPTRPWHAHLCSISCLLPIISTTKMEAYNLTVLVFGGSFPRTAFVVTLIPLIGSSMEITPGWSDHRDPVD